MGLGQCTLLSVHLAFRTMTLPFHIGSPLCRLSLWQRPFAASFVLSSANKCLLKVAHFCAQLEQYEKAIEIYEQVCVGVRGGGFACSVCQSPCFGIGVYGAGNSTMPWSCGQSYCVLQIHQLTLAALLFPRGSVSAACIWLTFPLRC